METGKELESLQLHLNTYYNTRKNIYFRPLTHEDLAIDGFYAVHHSDGIWYRLKLTIIKGTIAGKLIDFGLWSQIPLDRIQPLWPQFRNLPSQAIHASLAGTNMFDFQSTLYLISVTKGDLIPEKFSILFKSLKMGLSTIHLKSHAQ